jgi:hypothetical protein
MKVAKKTHPTADLPGRGAKQQRIIGCFQRRPRSEGALHLTRSEFVLDRPQRQSDLIETRRKRGEHRLHQIHVGFGVVGKAGLHRPGADRATARPRQASLLLG